MHRNFHRRLRHAARIRGFRVGQLLQFDVRDKRARRGRQRRQRAFDIEPRIDAAGIVRHKQPAVFDGTVALRPRRRK